MSTGFKITDNKGFQVTFSNGWTASIQFGYGNYCENYNNRAGEECQNAEIAAWDSKGNWYRFESEDTVLGYQSPQQALAFLNMVSMKEPCE